MKIVQINATCGAGSTGKICVAVSRLLTEKGTENYVLYSSGTSDYPLGIKYASNVDIKLGALSSRIFGNYGFNAKKVTKKLISELERISPDIVHIHNIHSHNCDLTLLFNYFKEKKTKLFWTFHDCWSFTAYCPYFDMVGCVKWKNECHHCSQRKKYSWFFDRSETLYKKKKELFAGLDLTVITPSEWLAELTRESFLGKYPVKVINNGIDLSVFSPKSSDFREKHGLTDKKIVLGVAFDWDARKGLDVFKTLAEKLPDDHKIVLVGTNDAIDAELPENILSIHRTKNQAELAEIYSAADIFVNPTREENFPTVNIESIACGTPVLTFNTGGSTEMLDETSGTWVEKNDVEGLLSELLRITRNEPYSKEACRTHAEKFDADERFKEYIELYSEK